MLFNDVLIMDWPILYKQVLQVKNPKNSVGVAVMWTERQVVADILKSVDYCAIGNLYSSAGISAIIRNVFANPHIRHIVLWGADLSRSGQALLAFMENGVDDQYFIVGDEKKGQIELDIPKDAIDIFRSSVTVHNLRGKPISELTAFIEGLNKTESTPFCEPKLFTTTRPKPFTYPSEQIGFRCHGNTAAQTWLSILNTILRYGRNKTTRYTQENELKEILNMMAVVYEENPDDPYLPSFFPFSKKDLDVYYPQVLSSKPIAGIAYTYGQRLRDHEGVDQIQNIIDLIKNRPFSKKMVAFTANVKEDWSQVNKGDTPCLTQILCSVQDDRLFMTTHFRSQDMVHGWPRNVFSLRKLQKLIADEAGGYKLGAFVMITHSAHIYSDDYALVEKILKENYEKELGYSVRQHFEEDPRGNVIIEIEEVAGSQPLEVQEEKRVPGRPTKYADDTRGKTFVEPAIQTKPTYEIVAKLYAPNGGLLLKDFRGVTAMEVYMQMTDWNYLVMPSHLIYIGTELQRAEYAIKEGKVASFSQDPAPNKGL
jgi:thymidylate synthase